MIIYLTGATGLAGAAIAEAAARRGHSVIGVGFRHESAPPGVSTFLRHDFRDQDTVVQSLLDYFPEVIINAAAIADASECEANPEDSARLNVQLPATLARLAHHLSARLIQISTDMVFDGLRGDYKPQETPNPTSLYGRQKLEAETEILHRAPEFATIIRSTLLTGNSLSGQRSVHEKLFAAWADGQSSDLFEDEFRQPCLAENLAQAVIEISERNDLFGTFHWAGHDPLSRFEIGEKILQHFNLPENLVKKSRLTGNPKSPNRPANLTLDTNDLSRKLKTRPLPFNAQLDTFKIPVPFRPWYHNQ